MIALLTGNLVFKAPDRIVLDVAGTGYEISVPLSTFEALPGIGEPAVVHTYLHVREDALQLFGFGTPEEKQVFVSLIGLSGVGPKLALNILSGSPIDQFLAAVESEDVALLSRIPGLGKKTATKIVFEMRGKLPRTGDRVRPKDEALSALLNLGYKKATADAALAQVDESLSLEGQITAALKIISGN